MFYLGIDVSKAKLDCSLISDSCREKSKSKVVANSLSGISDLLRWLDKQGAAPELTHAVMEGAGCCRTGDQLGHDQFGTP